MFGWQNLDGFSRSRGDLIGPNIGFAILFLLIRWLLRGIPVRSGERRAAERPPRRRLSVQVFGHDPAESLDYLTTEGWLESLTVGMVDD
jgi:hypothetical protein